MKSKKVFKSPDKILTEVPISEIMTKKPFTLSQKTTIKKAIDALAKHQISGILVVDKDMELVGIVSEGDILSKVFAKNKDMNKVTLKNIMTTNLITVTPNTSIGKTSTIMKKHNISKLPVTKNNKLIGYVAKGDLLEKLNFIYYQNAKLKWMPLLVTILFIVITIMLILLIGK